MKYYEATVIDERMNENYERVPVYEYERVTFAESKELHRDVFGIKGKQKRPFEVGQKIKIRNMYTGKNEGIAEVVSLEFGFPFEIRKQDGSLDTIFGYIIQLIPLLLALWEEIKSLFKKKTPEQGAYSWESVTKK